MDTTDAGRVVVTGVGVISSIGTGAAAFGSALRAGRCGAVPVRAFDTTGYAHAVGCELPGIDLGRWIQRLDPAAPGPATRLSVAAARMAAGDAGLTGDGVRTRRVVIAIGTTDGESRDLDELTGQEVAGGPGAMDPAIAGRVNASRLSTAVAWEFGLTDVEAVTIPTACAAGNYAIGYGFDAIRAGEADLAFCGGADAMCRKTFTGFYRLGAMARERCRPFDRDRDGMLVGEGAGVLLLESLASARVRGAHIHAEVLGYGLNCDADHPVAPDRDSVARCIRLALKDAGVEPADVDLISAHGTATVANDVAEAGAIGDVFGERPPPAVSMKSMLGHTLGAASALAAIGCVLAISGGFIPPTINHTGTDPLCPVDCVPNTARDADLRVVQNNALAFGGNNAVVVLGRYGDR
jgi:3-oxoacyl-[acyl-carrier-protein] synthase II